MNKASNNLLMLGSQTISFMAERVVGTGSFGVVFQVSGSFVIIKHI